MTAAGNICAPKPAPGTVRRILRDAGRQADEDIDIGAAALALASLRRPATPLAPYQRHLDKLTEDVAAYVAGTKDAPSLALRHEALVQVIHRRHGYGGTEESFDDVEAANLMRVIDRRAGLPVALGILYLHVAAKLGWPASGIDFPGRFVLRLETGEGRIIFDAFEGGREVSAPELRHLLKQMVGPDAELAPAHYREAGPRAVLLRLQNNIKARHLDANQIGKAIKILETMVLFAPDNASCWRERGVLLARQGDIAEAVVCLEECLRLGGSEQDRYATSALLQELRPRLDG